MISVNKLVEYLDIKQIKSGKQFTINTNVKPDERHIYDHYILQNKYEFINKKIEKIPDILKSIFNTDEYNLIKDDIKKNTFFSSSLNCIMTEYRHFTNKSRDVFIKKMFQQMAHDLNEKDLYHLFLYNKNHTFSHQKLEKLLNNSYDYDFDDDKHYNIKKYFVDYFSLNIYIISKENEKINNINVEKYKYQNKNQSYCQEYTLDIYNPTIILYKENNRYSSIVREESASGIFLYANDKELIEILDKYQSKSKNPIKKKIVSQEKESKQKKYKLSELHELANKMNISIYKQSEKTGKTLKKTIKELEKEIII
jgi:hypothetical protein